MSLILEALRKSEAERRRGLAPDLHTELPPAPVRGVPARAAWWAAAVVLVAALGTWFALGDDPATRPGATTPLPPSPPADADAAQLRPTRALPARTPPVRTPPPADAASVATPSRPTAVDSATTGPAAAVPRTAPARAPASATGTSAPGASAPAAADRAPAPSVASGDAHAPPGDGRILSLAELDPATRKALPPLKLSMHLWNEDPARRFVIVDGQRLGEGDRVGEASITRIERDGVLLEWHGRGIRVPVH